MEAVLENYFNGLCCPPVAPNYNFDVDSDWAGVGITDKATFESALGVTCGAFAITGNKIEAEILSVGGGVLNLKGKNITNVNYITFSGLLELNLNSNQISNFNPSIALPSGLQSLDLAFNQIVTFNPTIALPSGLQNLYLADNQIVTFNPNIALPSGLQSLNLGSNQMTTAGYIASETWATNQPAFSSNCLINFGNNPDSISGTNLEAILLTKNTTIET